MMDSPDAARLRIRRRSVDRMNDVTAKRAENEERARKAAAEFRSNSNGNGAAPAADSNKIAEDLANQARRIASIKAGISAQETGIARTKRDLASAAPREKPELQRKLNEETAAYDSALENLALAEELQIAAQNRQADAEKQAASQIEDVISRVDTAARAFREHLVGALEALQTIEGEGATVEVLCGSIKSHLGKNELAAACFEVGLAPRYLDLPGHGAHKPQTLAQALTNYATSARLKRYVLKKTKER